jgi:uncharacterized membrane protein YdjX (TVP38/TMEM64 family)
MKNQKKIKLFIFLIIFLLVISFAVFNYFSKGIVYDFFSGNTDKLTDFFDGNFLGIIVFIAFVILEVVFISVIPSAVLYTSGGLIFGPVYGSIIILIGNIIGASIAYFLSRYFLQDYFETRINKKTLKTFNKYAHKYGAYVIFFLRLNPFTSSDVFNYVAGLTKMKFSSFIIGTTLGLIPLIILTVTIGSNVIAGNPFLTFLFAIFGFLYIATLIYFLMRKN